MASNSKDIILQLKAENKQLKAKLKQSERDVGKFSKKAQGAFDKLKSMKNLIAGGFFASRVVSAVKASASMESMEVAFSVMLGSGEKSKKLLAEIEEFSASTSFQFPQLAEGAKKLLAFGTSSEEVVDKMRMLGDASSGNSEVLDRLVNAYGKLQAKGKASLEELNMITEAGVPILKELGKMYGVNKTEMFKLISTGKVGFKEVDMALQNLTTGSGKFAGMMEKQSKTLAGAFSTLKDQFGIITRKMGDAMLPSLKNLVKAMGFATTSSGFLSKAFYGIGKALGAVINSLATVITYFQKLKAEQQADIYMANSRYKLEQATALIKKDRVKYEQKARKLLKESQKWADKALEAQYEANELNKAGRNFAHEILHSQKEINKAKNKQRNIEASINKIKSVPDASGKKGKKGKSEEEKAFEKELEKQVQKRNQFEEKWTQKLREHNLTRSEIMMEDRENDLILAEEYRIQKAEIEKYYDDLMMQNKVQAIMGVSQFASTNLSQISRLYAMETNNRIGELNKQKQAEIDAVNNSTKTEEEKQKAIEQINKKYKKKENALKLKAWKQQRKINIAQAVLDIPLQSNSAYKAMVGIPLVGPVLAFAAAAAATAFGLKKLQLIASAPPPVYKKGRVPLYRNGYIPEDHHLAYIGNREAVINADATRANYDLLSYMNATGNRPSTQTVIKTTIPVQIDGKQIGLAVDEYRDENSKNSGLGNYASRGAY